MNRIKFYAAGLAMVLAVCSAFAPSKSGTFDSKYQVSGTDGSYYILGVNITGETPGPITYQCNASTTPCTADLNSSNIVSRNGNQEVLISNTGNVSTGIFQNNQ